MAIAERHLAAEFGDDVVDHRTYVLASDGDLMEGISQEAIALAGHLKLNKLIVLFDDNGISIDGPLSLSDSVDQVKRFEAAGWAATRIDGHDPEAIARGDREGEDIRPADADRLPHHDRLRRADQGRHREVPRLAARRRRDQGRARKARLERAAFEIPADVLELWRAAGQRSKAAHAAWDKRLAALPADKRAEFERRMRGELPKDKLAAAVRAVKEKLTTEPKEIATRAACEFALEA